jgi:hypothetical protein
MDDLAQYVFDLNVKRFVERLRSEDDPDMRASVRKVLVEEVDKFCQKRERLIQLQRHIGENSHRIASQEAFILRPRSNGQDLKLAQIALRNLVEIQTLFEQYYYRRSQETASRHEAVSGDASFRTATEMR